MKSYFLTVPNFKKNQVNLSYPLFFCRIVSIILAVWQERRQERYLLPLEKTVKGKKKGMRKKKAAIFVFFVMASILLIDGKMPQAKAETKEAVQQGQQTVVTVKNKKELYTVLSEQLMQRRKNFYIDYQGKADKELKKIGKQLNAEKTETYWKGMYTLLQNMAELVDDPLTTSDSDYLTGIIDYAFIYYMDGMFCFEDVHYYETAAQTRKVDKKINEVLKKRNLYEETDPVTIVERIHKYVINRIAYDGRKENKCNYSVYDGLFKQRTVCNGYALLTYKMLNELGVPCKYISGPAKNEDGDMQLHAWNIVKIGKKWYNLDTTWDDNDDGRVYYDYFLCGNKMFRKDHMPDSWYRTKSYLDNYKISTKDYSFA